MNEEYYYEERKVFFDSNYNDLVSEFFKTLSADDVARTDDSDEIEYVLDANRDDWESYVDKEFQKALDNDWGR